MNMLRNHCSGLVFLWSLWVLNMSFDYWGQAEEVVLFPASDATLFEPSPMNNLGASDSMAAGTTVAGKKTRALIRFDLTSIPPGAKIVSAELEIRVTRQPSSGVNNSDFQLYRVLKDWSEGNKTGNSGSRAETGVTWVHSISPDSPWSEPGGVFGTDFSETPRSSSSVGSLGDYVFPGSDLLVEDLQDWLSDPGTNFGWILISDQESVSGTARRIESREGADGGAQLRVTYEDQTQVSKPILTLVRGETGQEFLLEIKARPGSTLSIERSNDLETWLEEDSVLMPVTGESLLIPVGEDGVSPAFFRLKVVN